MTISIWKRGFKPNGIVRDGRLFLSLGMFFLLRSVVVVLELEANKVGLILELLDRLGVVWEERSRGRFAAVDDAFAPREEWGGRVYLPSLVCGAGSFLSS